MSTRVAEAASNLAGHGSGRLTVVEIDSYNVELLSDEGFVGDRVSGRAFRSILESIRESLRSVETDPVGQISSDEISKKKLDRLLMEGDPEAAGVVLGTIETFAQAFATVIRRFMRLKTWRDTQCIVVGGGLRNSRVGELAVGRAAVILKTTQRIIRLQPIRHHPDEAGLLGCIHLAPSWVFSGYHSVLAVDIGGSNIRVGVVDLNLDKAIDLSKSKVWISDLWRHVDDQPDRAAAVDGLVTMLQAMIKRSNKEGHLLAPFIGIGCPGQIRVDGSIEKGGQNLPGDWQHSSFNLANLLKTAIPMISGHETAVLMHNDAVVQGLSEAPFMRDVTHWGVMTIGTGLGNARFTNRTAGKP